MWNKSNTRITGRTIVLFYEFFWISAKYKSLMIDIDLNFVPRWAILCGPHTYNENTIRLVPVYIDLQVPIIAILWALLHCVSAILKCYWNVIQVYIDLHAKSVIIRRALSQYVCRLMIEHSHSRFKWTHGFPIFGSGSDGFLLVSKFRTIVEQMLSWCVKYTYLVLFSWHVKHIFSWSRHSWIRRLIRENYIIMFVVRSNAF